MLCMTCNSAPGTEACVTVLDADEAVTLPLCPECRRAFDRATEFRLDGSTDGGGIGAPANGGDAERPRGGEAGGAADGD